MCHHSFRIGLDIVVARWLSLVFMAQKLPSLLLLLLLLLQTQPLQLLLLSSWSTRVSLFVVCFRAHSSSLGPIRLRLQCLACQSGQKRLSSQFIFIRAPSIDFLSPAPDLLGTDASFLCKLNIILLAYLKIYPSININI